MNKKKLFLTLGMTVIVLFFTFNPAIMVIGGVQNIPLYISTNSITIINVIGDMVITITGLLFLISLYFKVFSLRLLLNLFFGLQIFFSTLFGLLSYNLSKIKYYFPSITTNNRSFFPLKDQIFFLIIYIAVFITVWALSNYLLNRYLKEE